MKEVSNNLTTNLIDVDYLHGEAVGVCVMLHGLNINIIQEAIVMNQIYDSLEDLSKFVQKLSNNITESSKSQALAENQNVMMNSIMSGLMGLGFLSMMNYQIPSEGAELTGIKKLSSMVCQGLSNNSLKLILGSQILVGVSAAKYSIEKGRYASNAMQMQAEYAELNPVIDVYTNTNDACSKTISADTKTIKEVVEQDFSSKKKGLYFYR